MTYLPKATTVALLETLGLQTHLPRIVSEEIELYAILDACERLRDKRLLSFADSTYQHWNPVADARLISVMKDSMADQGENAAANALAKVLILCGMRDESLLSHLEPWYQMPFLWSDRKDTADSIFSALEAHGFSTRTAESDDLVRSLLFDPFLGTLNNDHGRKIRAALFGSRVIECCLSDHSYTPGHNEMFAELAEGADPPVLVTSVSQRHEMRERYRDIRNEATVTTIGTDGTERTVDLATEMPDVVAVLEIADDAVWAIEYSYESGLYSFHARDLGRYADIEAVTGEFNRFMAKIGRSDRVFRIDPPPIDHDEFFGEFIVADEFKFRHLAEILCFPLP